MRYKKVVVPLLVTALVASNMGMTGTMGNVMANEVDEIVTISPMNASTFSDGKFEGWGTSFCWWANRLGYSDSLATQAANAFYDKEQGLGLNIVRYNIGGGDDPTHTHITRTDSEVPGYAINPSYDEATGTYAWEYDWSADANQRNVLLKAMEACGDEIIVEAFSNSPPYFMTNSGCSTGATDASKDNLKSDAYEEFAQYMADVVEHFEKDWGVDIQSVSPMNEPYTNYWGANSWKQEGCHFDQGNSQSNILVEMGKALAEKGLSDIQVVGTDETSIDTQISSYNKLSEEAKNLITRIDTHTYGGSKRASLKSLAESEGKNLWMSEVDGGDTAGTDAGEMGSALWLAQRIITDMNGMTPSAWIMWQVIDNHICEEGYNGKQDSGMVDTDGGFWGAAVADHDNETIIKTMKYYGLGQFSRYIRPGYTIIAGTENTLAAYDSEGKKLVIVATNTSAKDKVYDFDLSQFSAVGSNVQVIRTSGDMETGEKWAQLAPVTTYGKGFEATLKANSITTYIVEGVENDGVTMQEIPLSMDMVTGSEPWGGSDNIAKLTVDGDASTYFDGVGDGFVTIDLGDFYQLDAISFAPRAGYGYRCVDAGFFGSVDGNNWSKIATITSLPSNDFNYIFEKRFEHNMAVRYVKYAVPSGTPNNGVNTDGSYCCNIAEIKLYGTAATTLETVAGVCATYEKVEQGNYTNASYETFMNALIAAKSLVEAQSADEAALMQAMDTMIAAYTGLTLAEMTPVEVTQEIAKVVTYVGTVPQLPETVSVKTLSGETAQANVTWQCKADDFSKAYETVSVIGKVEHSELTVEAAVEVIPKNLLYFIDCGTVDSGSDTYDAVASVTTLKNAKSDQLYDGNNGWGVSGTYHAYTGEPSADKFLTGYYADNKSTNPIIYTVSLEAGTYDVSIQSHEWWSGPRTMNVEAHYQNAAGETVTTMLAEKVKVSSSNRNALVTATLTLDAASVVEIHAYLSDGSEAPVVTFVGIAREQKEEEPEQPEVSVKIGDSDLIIPQEIANKQGTTFTGQIRVGSLEKDAKVIEAVLTVDKNLKIIDVAVDEHMMGGTLNWHVEEQDDKNILRLVYADLTKNTTITTTQDAPFDMIAMTFELANKVEEGAKITIALNELQQYVSSETAVSYVKEPKVKTITAIEEHEVSVVVEKLYTGDGSDLIPKGETAYKVVVTGLETIPKKVTFASETEKSVLYQSEDFTKRDDVITYVMVVSETVSEDVLQQAENYTFTMDETLANESILLGDTNEDGVIDAQDALKEVRTWLRKDTPEITDKLVLTYNVNGDAKLNSADALAIVEHFVSGKSWAVLNNH